MRELGDYKSIMLFIPTRNDCDNNSKKNKERKKKTFHGNKLIHVFMKNFSCYHLKYHLLFPFRNFFRCYCFMGVYTVHIRYASFDSFFLSFFLFFTFWSCIFIMCFGVFGLKFYCSKISSHRIRCHLRDIFFVKIHWSEWRRARFALLL